RGRRGFARISLAPVWAAKQPTELEPGPALRLDEADPPDELARIPALDGPHAVAAQRPMAEEGGHRAPCFGPGLRDAGADVAHHLGVGTHRRIEVEIGIAPRAHHEARRLEFGNLHRPPATSRS